MTRADKARWRLYRAAQAADIRYGRACRQAGHGRDRWTLTREQHADPRVACAYLRKLQADAAWLDDMRTRNTTGG